MRECPQWQHGDGLAGGVSVEQARSQRARKGLSQSPWPSSSSWPKFAADQRLLRDSLSRRKTHSERIVVLEKLVLGKESTIDKLAQRISDAQEQIATLQDELNGHNKELAERRELLEKEQEALNAEVDALGSPSEIGGSGTPGLRQLSPMMQGSADFQDALSQFYGESRTEGNVARAVQERFNVFLQLLMSAPPAQGFAAKPAQASSVVAGQGTPKNHVASALSARQPDLSATPVGHGPASFSPISPTQPFVQSGLSLPVAVMDPYGTLSQVPKLPRGASPEVVPAGEEFMDAFMDDSAFDVSDMAHDELAEGMAHGSDGLPRAPRGPTAFRSGMTGGVKKRLIDKSAQSSKPSQPAHD